MLTDSFIREQSYTYFLNEVPELLQTIEQELYSLAQDYSIAKVHNLMRAAHTIKGGAAIVELKTINKIAHSLEDIIRCLYNSEVVIDAELQTLLLQAYECLRLPITAEISGSSINDEEVLQRATTVFARLHEKLGNALDIDNRIPTSVELGFDIVQSIFETGVQQRLESIAQAIQDVRNTDELADFLRSQAEVFLGLAESLNLPGFGEITKTTLAALEANPTCTLEIAELALADFQREQKAIIAGDRTGSEPPSAALRQLSQPLIKSFNTLLLPQEEAHTDIVRELTVDTVEDLCVDSPATTTLLRDEISKLYKFLIKAGSTKNKSLTTREAKLYLKVIRYILGWFNHQLKVPYQELSLALLVPKVQTENSLEELENWLSQWLEFLTEPMDNYSLSLYRQGIIFKVLFAVAKFQYKTFNSELPVLQALKNRIIQIAKEYKNYPPITEQEKNWLDSPKLQKLLEIKTIHPTLAQANDSLIETIWGTEIASASSIETNSDESVEFPQSLVIQESATIDRSETVAEFVTSDSNLKIEKQVDEKNQPSQNARQNSFIRVDVESLNTLNYQAGELLICQKRQHLYDEQLGEIIEQLFHQLQRHQKTLNQLRELPLQGQNSASKNKQNFADIKFDTLEMDEYTEFNVNLYSAIEETFQLQETTESLDLLTKQATQIQEKSQRLTLNIIDNLVEVRMIPLGDILNPFPQMVQNLGNLYGKLIDIKFTGTHVLIEKAIAEKLSAPLLQLVRNAFDHGIELPEIRRDLGKLERGLIEICAYHQGSQTIIEVRDDGQGLDLDKICTKAVELDFISVEDARSYLSKATEEKLLELLFLPGFTTASKVSEISGRGMGLDIVRSQLYSLNGSITVQSLPNQGTTFILKIPFSMTTDKLMLVQAGGIVYALLLDSIEKIIFPSAHTIKEFEGKKVLYWKTDNDECMVSIRHLSELIDYNSRYASARTLQNKQTDSTENLKNPVLLLRRNQERVGLEVDQIIGEQELVIRPLGQTIAPPKYIYGCSSLANGNMVLVIDAALLLEPSNQMQAVLDTKALSPATSQQKALPVSPSTLKPIPLLNSSSKQEVSPYQKQTYQTPKVVLVVDDAISLRQTLSLTLQKFGYQVLQAQNGVEALEQLQAHPEIQVIISDLEMPRMNGFELLSHIQHNPNLANLPIVVLTSRSTEKHRCLARELGAKAYITKPYLEHEFISTIESLLTVSSEK
ncbi:response regulator [Scytonema sp. UIC 10036]|uniref:hybrid sensor histidine kinase/response regulator n=1 Tax=Scytonema sp. UIC 10036 TaxID=2304196 RepID=UPI0012DAC6BD|nr:hybrid sensor histidine kinase/response regulator [Scytonema sp. UIC 10036]MUG95647.1 response regulator [Scytonema sp. UIC 10036]